MAQQKSILITGCSSGIGRDAAVTLRARGWRVFASCRKQSDCDVLRAQGFDSPLIDYEDETTIAAGLDAVLRATDGTLDALYNNGAYGIPGRLEDLPTEALRAILQANVIGYHDLTRRVIPVMRAQGGGRIVNCSSVLGYTWLPWRGAYIASKFALEGMTDVLRVELHDDPIHVSLIQPGLIDTRFSANSKGQFERWIDWEASAKPDLYRQKLIERWRGSGQNSTREAPASAVTAKLIHALEAQKPRPRYRVTGLAQLARVLTRVLPTTAADWIIRRAE
ncbi:MAG: SDR family NAD(P)-dependent oxidoreductase [Pseudomonadota bacterium]